jgi:hypothetical protein
MRASRVAAVVALLACAATGLAVLEAHYDAMDAEKALLFARSAQFGPTTKARIGTWFRAQHAHTPLSWSSGPDETGAADVEVRLQAGDLTYRFSVVLAARQVRPADAATEALVAEVRAWAAK